MAKRNPAESYVSQDIHKRPQKKDSSRNTEDDRSFCRNMFLKTCCVVS